MSEFDAVGTEGPPRRGADSKQVEARDELRRVFEEEGERVFFCRQLETRFEDRYFHWITHRALRDLIDEGLVRSEERALRTGGRVLLVWHKGYRYYRRQAQQVVGLVEEYSDPNIGGALGLHGEAMVLEGFARSRFVMEGRETRAYGDREWSRTGHDLDFVFGRDGRSYGVEVKNTLSYMDYEELTTKVRMCLWLGIRPVFVARMLPKNWIEEVRRAGGFSLILKYQLYPWSHGGLAKKVRSELGLPVDSPKRLQDKTMSRFEAWHRGLCESGT